MKIKFTKQKLTILLISFILLHSATAQLPDLKLTSSSGATIINANYNIDFTIGEIVTTNISNNLNLFTIGFLQPFNQPAPAPNISNFVLLYPVPAVNEINYLLTDTGFIPIMAQIISMSGSVLQTKQIAAGFQTGQPFKFNITSLSTGQYRIRFFNSNGNIRVGTFIKL
jgi:hypothetical protein